MTRSSSSQVQLDRQVRRVLRPYFELLNRMERPIQVSKRRRIAGCREASHPADIGVRPLKRFFCANNGDYKEKWRKQHAWKQPYLDHRRRPGSYCLDHLDRFGDLGHLLRVVRRSPGRSRPGLLRTAALWALPPGSSPDRRPEVLRRQDDLLWRQAGYVRLPKRGTL